MDRRNFLKWIIKGGGLMTAGMVAAPVLVTILSPLFQRRASLWAPVAEVADFTPGEVRHALVDTRRKDWTARSLREKGVYVWRAGPERFVVFSRSCTDLSCPVVHDAGSGWFFCPCHGGIFNQEGERMAGPPRQPLFRYTTRVQNGMLEIDLYSLPPMT
jgi:menaquinol-cytochrome c reductase iron-sulfur subunit